MKNYVDYPVLVYEQIYSSNQDIVKKMLINDKIPFSVERYKYVDIYHVIEVSDEQILFTKKAHIVSICNLICRNHETFTHNCILYVTRHHITVLWWVIS
jgi:hypothetical protein